MINFNIILRSMDYALVGGLSLFTLHSTDTYIVPHFPSDINKKEASTQKRKQFRFCAVKGALSEWRGC